MGQGLRLGKLLGAEFLGGRTLRRHILLRCVLGHAQVPGDGPEGKPLLAGQLYRLPPHLLGWCGLPVQIVPLPVPQVVCWTHVFLEFGPKSDFLLRRRYTSDVICVAGQLWLKAWPRSFSISRGQGCRCPAAQFRGRWSIGKSARPLRPPLPTGGRCTRQARTWKVVC